MLVQDPPIEQKKLLDIIPRELLTFLGMMIFPQRETFRFPMLQWIIIFWLDANDVLWKEDQEKFLTLKHTLPSDVDSVTMVYSLA